MIYDCDARNLLFTMKMKEKTFHLCSIMPQSIADKLISPQPVFFYEISNLTFLPSANAEILT